MKVLVVRSVSNTWHTVLSGESRNRTRTTCNRLVIPAEVKDVPMDSYDDLSALARGPRGGYRPICGECEWPEEVSN